MPKVTDLLAIAVQADVIPLQEGPPGSGKTATSRALAAALGMRFDYVAGGSAKDDDCYVNHVTSDGRLRRVPAQWAHEAKEAFERDGTLTLYLVDELTDMPRLVQAAYQTVLSERRIGSFELPFIRFVAACNPPEIATNGAERPPAIANRFLHLPSGLITDTEEWCAGLLAGFPPATLPKLPAGWEVGIGEAAAVITAYATRMPAAFANDVPRDTVQQGRAWASRRTWTWTARILAACKAAAVPEEVRMTLVAGLIGEACALPFLVWLHELDLPDPEEILKDPSKLKLPARGDLRHAVFASIVAAVLRRNTPERWAAACEALCTAGEDSLDVVTHAARALMAHKPAGTTTPAVVGKLLPLLKAAGLA